jgi:hypothetical protein
MKKLLFSLITCLSLFGLIGCVENVAYADPVAPQITYGCAIVEDAYGEREVCDTSYYVTSAGVVYWDPYFHIWVGGGFYFYNNAWYRGYYPGYVARYGGFYHGHGFYRGYRGGHYGAHWGRSHGGFHGGSHSSGGFHSGGHVGGGHGGHGGHR